VFWFAGTRCAGFHFVSFLAILMPMIEHKDQIEKLLEENLKVVKENHELLEKMHRIHVYTFWMKFAWFLIIIGIPVIMYYLVLHPYVQALGGQADQIGEALKSASYFFKSFPIEELAH
jgi:hypothetical protein